MKIRSCQREDELLDALSRGFVAPELSAHAAECPFCSELRVVAGALIEERAQAIAAAPVPSAGAMWMRMQIRRRQEAQARTRRSLLIGQAATVGIAIALVVSLFGADLAIGVRDMIASIRMSTPLLFAAVTWILAAPIAGYVATRGR